MKNINTPTTDHIRMGYCTASYDENADTEFDLWFATERNRVAELATAKERERIRTNILERVQDLMSCNKNDDCNEWGQHIEGYIQEWLDD